MLKTILIVLKTIYKINAGERYRYIGAQDKFVIWVTLDV